MSHDPEAGIGADQCRPGHPATGLAFCLPQLLACCRLLRDWNLRRSGRNVLGGRKGGEEFRRLESKPPNSTTCQ